MGKQENIKIFEDTETLCKNKFKLKTIDQKFNM